MLGIAVSFNETAAALYERIQESLHDSRPMIPFVVNSSFSIEVFLKTIGEVHGASLRGHDLLELYRQLPVLARQAIQAAVPGLVGRYGIAPTREFESLLAGLSDAFVKWRYAWERPEGVGYFGVVEAIAALHVLHNVGHEMVWGGDWSTRTKERPPGSRRRRV